MDKPHGPRLSPGLCQPVAPLVSPIFKGFLASLAIEISHWVFQGGVGTAQPREDAARSSTTASCTHLVPSLAAKLQPKVLLLREVEVAAGEVEQPFPAGLLLANKQNGSSRLGDGDSSGGGVSVGKGEKF